MWAQLAKRKITTQDHQSCGAECLSQRYQQRGGAIRSGSVREDEAVATRICREVKVSSNGYFIWRSIQKLLTSVHDRLHASMQFYEDIVQPIRMPTAYRCRPFTGHS